MNYNEKYQQLGQEEIKLRVDKVKKQYLDSLSESVKQVMDLILKEKNFDESDASLVLDHLKRIVTIINTEPLIDNGIINDKIVDLIKKSEKNDKTT